MQKHLLAGCLLLFCLFSKAQSPPVRGLIRDTAENKPIRYAVVALLQKTDSTLIRFTRSDEKGGFELNPGKAGHFILLITSPGFANYADTIVLEKAPIEMGQIALTPKSVLMKEVVVRSGAAIRMKGDTTEFTADSFHVREGATVEDLLKQLPGLTVNSKGEITAQGKKVDKVLVDGEEFFGEDPTLATQNIGARAVDKVQVFDTKTETQQLTGQVTGNEGKTINIKLKDEAKKGSFGKAEASSDFDKFLNGQALYNHFQGKKKIASYLIKSNTSAGNLNWEDRQKLGIDNDMQYDEIGGYYFSFNTDDGFSDWNLRGLPSAWSGGALFSNKWNQDKNSFNGAYKYNRLDNHNLTTSFNQTLLADTTYFNNSQSATDGWKQQHNITGKMEWKPDSLTNIKFSVGGTYRQGHNVTDYSSEALNESEQPVNTGNRSTVTDLDHYNLENALSYKRLSAKKKDRFLLSTLRLGFNDDRTLSSLTSSNKFYKNGILDSSSVTDQYKKNLGNSVTVGTRTTFSEPLNNKWIWVSDVSFNSSHSESGRNTYEKDGLGKYTVLNPVYSNHFNLNANSAGVNTLFRYTTKKIRAIAGGGLTGVNLNLLNTDTKKRSKYDFVNFEPQVSFNYQLKQQTGINLRYQGNRIQPTIDQLQPVRANDDPLNIVLGNPDLRVGYNHRVSVFFNTYKMLTQRSLFLNAGFNFVEHAVTTTSSIDAFGVRTYMPVNVNGNRNWYSYWNWDLGNKPKKINSSFNGSANGGRNVNFINGQENKTRYAELNLEYNARYYIEEKFSFSLNPGIRRNLSSSSLRKGVNNNYWSWGGRADLYVKLPGKIELNSNVDFRFQEKTSVFRNTPNVIQWDGNLQRKFGKKKSGMVFLNVHDLLRQNKGIDRNTESSFISEERYQLVGRYFMLGFRWSFNSMPGAANGQ